MSFPYSLNDSIEPETIFTEARRGGCILRQWDPEEQIWIILAWYNGNKLNKFQLEERCIETCSINASSHYTLPKWIILAV